MSWLGWSVLEGLSPCTIPNMPCELLKWLTSSLLPADLASCQLFHPAVLWHHLTKGQSLHCETSGVLETYICIRMKCTVYVFFYYVNFSVEEI